MPYFCSITDFHLSEDKPQMTAQLTSFTDEHEQHILNFDYVWKEGDLNHMILVHAFLKIRVELISLHFLDFFQLMRLHDKMI
jgi:hypothetical protein